ncbi:tripartite tricarboxylate transporter substrate binding protein [Caldimonas thermodepolymerans]|jgi:tripartite-type tricarboxylate transporter receptor subunit TctC|uniref:ABC transporter substrate-binding protein n=1 Tax=Caldimonas thermodepolymerans TaxID=215580 RepID=A0A2S5T860_9BURK|nr:tripartite tricarboxylate transporter substrate binding protein [Caldimonas thermodepolymerans]PPE71112.1 ABC transporter substrate-binding protein [Caldimonas thermodepolymerans]QPC31416.1 tripartite tricarboxylate transporter substrate binding protein [Caldimonas thermodepolymerans]RDH99614.1 tripartite-type tricarboxylate transporter receptor subunit TctC [Caldimonas thermodepolymerans]TCP07660.1 tripartite-type tricarboxylate transporter receptor subunit TctC [Caldimonas thermodepolymera
MAHVLNRRQCLVATALLALGITATAASAYPDKPVTFVVPFAAGSATDQIARALAEAFTAETRQPVVIENKAGASGMLAAQAVARAPADGYTVLITTNTTHAANEHLYKKIGYDPVKDFAPVTALGKGGQVLVVHPESPFKTVADVIEHARKNPGKLSFGSGSSSSRTAGELFQQMAKVQLLHVPYKSNPNAITDLLGRQIDMMFADMSTGVPQIQGGKLRALGVTAAKRSPLLPQVPTIAEAGVPGYEIGYWFAAYVPAGTPAPVVQRLNELLRRATNGPAAKAFFEASGSEPFTGTPEELAQFQAAETRKWGEIIKAAGIQPE